MSIREIIGIVQVLVPVGLLTGALGGDPSAVPPLGDCAFGQAEAGSANFTGPQVGQDVQAALCALRRIGVRDLELAPSRRAVRIKTVEELGKLRTLADVQMFYEGKIVGGFVLADGKVVRRYLNPSPYFRTKFAVFAQPETVPQLIELAAERMRQLPGLSFVETVVSKTIALDELDAAAIAEAARSPQWRCGDESKDGLWGFTITLAGEIVQEVETHGTPPRPTAAPQPNEARRSPQRDGR